MKPFRTILIIVILLNTVMLTSCGEGNIKAMVRKFLNAGLENDLEKQMSTIHPDSDMFLSQEEMDMINERQQAYSVTEMERVDFDITFNSIIVEGMDDTFANASCNYTIEITSDEASSDYVETNTIHFTMKREGAGWKILDYDLEGTPYY